MIPFVLACVASVSLHWFVLSQWPSPVVQVPIWRSSEPLEVVYLPPAPARARALIQQMTDNPRRAGLNLPYGAVESEAPAKRVTRPAVERPARAEKPTASQRSAPQSQPRGGQTPKQQGSDPLKPIPSILTPADFAQFQYKQRVRQRLQAAIRYPMELGLVSGATRLRLTIGRDGQVRSAACLATDAPRFEEATLDGVMAAGPFGAFSKELAAEELTFDFRVAFSPHAETSISP